MDSARIVPGKKNDKRQLLPNPATVTSILWESAWNALVRAFLVQILGSIAISMMGQVFTEMTPSLPPGLAHKPEAEVEPSAGLHGVGTFVAAHNFWIIFVVLYLAITATAFARYLRNPDHRRLAAWLLRVNRRLSGHWFRVFVLNGFVAWISATVLMSLQQFSWAQILWNFLSGTVQPLAHALSRWLPGAGTLGLWYSWYGQNQARFLFWLLYSAAICDDLGLPNYKTLLRSAGRRLRGYLRARWEAGAAESARPS